MKRLIIVHITKTYIFDEDIDDSDLMIELRENKKLDPFENIFFDEKIDEDCITEKQIEKFGQDLYSLCYDIIVTRIEKLFRREANEENIFNK